MARDETEKLFSDLSCTFCGPGSWALWDVVTEDGVFFVCDRHHVEMSDAKMITLERRIGKKDWKEPGETNTPSEISNDFFDIEHERRDTY